MKAAKDLQLIMAHYVPDRVEEAVDVHTDEARRATYQVLLNKPSAAPSGPVKNLYVDIELPRGVQVSQRYYFKEGNVKYGEAPTTLCSIKELAQKPVLLRCKVPQLEAGVTIYVHATYPEDEYDDDELDDMRQQGRQATASLLVAGERIKATGVRSLRAASAAESDL